MAPRRASPPGEPLPPTADAAGAAGADGDPLAESLHRSALHLLRLLRRADEASGLSPARLSALSVLVFGGPTTLGALAAADGVSAPTMSRLVAELERDGYLRRRVDPADARTAHIGATAKAERLLHAGRARRLRALSAALGTLSAAQRHSIARALGPLATLNAALAAPPVETSGIASRVTQIARRGRRRFD
jgi:DNA-binding MarR family transcriptional regulator